MTNDQIIGAVNILDAIEQGASITRQSIVYTGGITEEIAYSINALLSLSNLLAQRISGESKLEVIRGGK